MTGWSDNARGGALMVFAMAFFAVADAAIKIAADHISQGLIVIIMGMGNGLLFSAIAKARQVAVFTRNALLRSVLARNLSEVLATGGIVMAVSLSDLSVVSAIQQTAPLIVVAGAVLFFGESIGWRRMVALAGGVAGMLLILRPGGAAFDPNLLFAVLAAVGFAARDLLTRAVPGRVHSLQLAALGSLALVPAGAILLWLTGGSTAWDARAVLPLLAAIGSSCAAYYAITTVMRIGEIGAVAPLRYTRLIFAAAMGILLFAERPDALTIAGSVLIVASGIYAIRRRQRVSGA